MGLDTSFDSDSESHLGLRKTIACVPDSRYKQVLQLCPAFAFIIDGIERPIRRPQDKAKQQENYSGKKTSHTLKNDVVTEKSTKKIQSAECCCEGKKHDKALAEEQAIPFPKGSKLWKDSGFQGYEPEGMITCQPMKKPKGKELTAEQKQHNKDISKECIGVEHSIGGVKVFGIDWSWKPLAGCIIGVWISV